MTVLRRVVAGVAVVAWTAGCAVRDAPIVVSGWPPSPGSARPSTSVIVQYRVEGRDEPIESWAERVRQPIVVAFRDSALFSRVEPGLGQTDLQVEVTVTERDDTNVPVTLLSGLTLMLLPTREGRDLRVATIVRDAHGTVRGSDDRHASLTNWIQLFLLAAPAENNPALVSAELIYDLERAAIVALHERGAL